jgi:hypothetical protein
MLEVGGAASVRESPPSWSGADGAGSQIKTLPVADMALSPIEDAKLGAQALAYVIELTAN